MSPDLTHIEFYFPDKSEDIASKEQFADLIVGMIKRQGSIEYSGHIDEQSLYDGILEYLGDGDISRYRPLSESQQSEIKKHIEITIARCDASLSLPTKNYIFIFPYLPTEQDKIFEGVMGVARYSCVSHIFLSPELWSPKALVNTIAHELNHTIFYYHHYHNFGNYTLLDEVIMEGLAENFTEHVVGAEPAPWSIALTRDQAFELVGSMDDKIFSSKNQSLIKGILFGNDTYQRWTGYSMGYWLVKEFMHKRSSMSWEEIMNLDSLVILDGVRK